MFLHLGENPKTTTKFLLHYDLVLHYYLDSKCSFLGKLSISKAEPVKSD